MRTELALVQEDNPVVFEKDGEVFASSRDVAEFFEKQHNNVLRDIDKIVKSVKISENQAFAGFEQVEEEAELGNGAKRKTRSYNMNRDGFMLLVMGFTGTKALDWKVKYIQAFNEMESEIRARKIDVRDPKQLTGIAIQLIEVNKELEEKVKEQQPMVEGFERIAVADGSLCITDAAKALQIRPKDLFNYLDQNGWTYRRPGGSNRIGYQSKVLNGSVEHKVTTVLRPDGSEKVSEQVRITPKGLTKLSTLIQPLKAV